MDNNLRLNLMIVIHIILILIIVGLMIKIKIQEKNYDIEDCKVYFKQYSNYEASNIKKDFLAEVFIVDLHKGYVKGDCPVRWDYMVGYTFKLPLDRINMTYQN